MDSCKQERINEDELNLLCSCTSKEAFVREFETIYSDKSKATKFYLLLLTELEKAISQDDIDGLKKLTNLIDYASDLEYPVSLRDCYDNASNPIRQTNLVILACEYNKVEVLEYLFDSNNRLLSNLSTGIGRTSISPDDENEKLHNAFYYAIRSENIQLLDTLINKWPDNYLSDHLEQLDLILSTAYEALKLRNVPLSDEVEFFVEKKLINLRFYSNALGQEQMSRGDLTKIKQRIELILQNIDMLTRDCSNAEEVDEKFLFVIKAIAHNIHTLKRQMKSTYVRLPWEEIEFCLVIFVSSHTKPQEMNLIFHATLNKRKILNYLGSFAERLRKEEENLKADKLHCLPRLSREKVVLDIISSYPQFEELYADYQQIRDIYSLQKMSDCINLALSADPREKQGQLIITRVLQVMGEHLKNSLESPKLSHTASEVLVLSLSKNSRKIIVDLRDSISHADSLSNRMEIEENANVEFFTNIQNDTKKVGDVITDILYKHKIKKISRFLEKIINSEDSDEIMEVFEELSSFELDEMLSKGNFKIMEYEQLEELVQELSDMVADKTKHEKKLLNKIKGVINTAGTRTENSRFDYVTGFKHLRSLSIALSEDKSDNNRKRLIRVIKFNANTALEKITPKVEPGGLKEITELSKRFSRSVKSRLQEDEYNDVEVVLRNINSILEFGIGGIKSIEELKETLLDEKDPFIPTDKATDTNGTVEDKYNYQLGRKLSDLEIIFRENQLSGSLAEKLPLYKRDKKLQGVVEMLILDIMSILDSLKHRLENNDFFLYDNAPLLNGKCLRNYLAHHNAVVDISLSDPSVAVLLNAKKLTEESLMEREKKIGKLVSDDLVKLKEKYDQCLVTIANQQIMFVALQEGNLESLKDCLKKGADVKARNINSWTTLHFAAKGPSLEVVKFLFAQNLDANVKDNDGQTLLHIAAAHGRQNIVDFLVREAGFNVDELNNTGKTPLHIAAHHGHEATVEVLIKNEANIVIRDKGGLPPLHYAIRNNHIGVVKILLQTDMSIDINETMDSFAPLHEAAENGHLDIVTFLLNNKADVNVTRTGKHYVVQPLDNTDSTVIHGFTPLHGATENGHEEIVNILLKHGACVNAVDKYHNTPLHYAASYGHPAIIKILLENNANVNAVTVQGRTPLHMVVRKSNLEIVTFLIKHGVNINAKDTDNETPLHYAALSGHKEVVTLLIRNGAEINAKANNNTTALHLAARNGHKDVSDLLVQNKAEINAQDIDGCTPLHEAALNGSKDIINLLIINKAQINGRCTDGTTPLHEAVKGGHVDAVGFLIEHQAGVHARRSDGCPPLHLAAHIGRKDIIHLLIKNGAEVDVRALHGMTPLHVATINRHVEAFNFLIKNKADVNARTDKDLTPLHFAAKDGHKDIVKLLIKHKARVDVISCESVTPLKLAVVAGHKEIVEILVANGANVNNKCSNLTPLLCAVKYNHKDIVKFLIAKGANVNEKGIQILLLAILAGYTDIVEILVKNKININNEDAEHKATLHVAINKGDKLIMRTLIKGGADVNVSIDNKTPLWIAAQNGYADIVEMLIAAGTDVNFKSDEDVTPLHRAATKGHINVVKVLLNNKVNINVEDHDKRTPLQAAVAGGHLEIVKMLLHFEKIDINFKGDQDFTLLHVAAYQENNLELVKYLVQEGADINARNSSGDKPIHLAARNGFEDVVEFFLSNGISIDDPGWLKLTILHCAAMNGHLELVNYLIMRGANLNSEDIHGVTPAEIAAKFDHQSVVELLLHYGAVYLAITVVEN